MVLEDDPSLGRGHREVDVSLQAIFQFIIVLVWLCIILTGIGLVREVWLTWKEYR